MPNLEWSEWSRNFLLSRPYVGGHLLESNNPLFAFDTPSSIVVRETLAGTHKLWRPFSQDKAPVGMAGVSITLNAYTFTEEDYRVFDSLARSGGTTTYADGRPVTDRFPNATAAQTLKLSRPLAIGTVAEVNETDFPTVVRLNGTITPSAASITGQTVTVNTTGDLEIVYTPLYTVVVLGVRWNVGGFNDLAFDGFSVVEAILGDFA